ncbi:hypothetical protein GCM10022631_14070 [Deinococcus rubellus]|uniref:MHYT domain-containing protein n=1 Tax=Deinococcus rubellus TaxID=1889240 RepID=UPI0031EC3A17
MDSHMLMHSWNWSLIGLSYAIAAVASYISLELAARAGQNPVVNGRFWLISQGLLLGFGIWAMHFIGMLAYQVPATVSFSLPLTIVSGLAAIACMIIAIFIVHSGPISLGRLSVAGVISGAGIVVMHYTGMSAFVVNASASYSTVPFILSILIAVGASVVALFLFKLLGSGWTVGRSPISLLSLKIGAGLVMGVAITGMHYTGMYAIQYQVAAGAKLGSALSGSDTGLLAILVAMVSFLLLGLAIMSIAMDAGSGMQEFEGQELEAND